MELLPSVGLPLVGLKVLEIGHYIAAPFCTRILADLGAEVIKLEPPGGDPFRGWGAAKDGHSVWFSIHGRNKLSVELDLKKDRERPAEAGGDAPTCWWRISVPASWSGCGSVRTSCTR